MDATAWALAVLAAVGPIITAVVGVCNLVVSRRAVRAAERSIEVSQLNSKKLDEVHSLANGMKSELVTEVRKASFAAGEKSEKDKQSDTEAQ